ncbi:1,4-alpha-glucan branching protein [Bosea sp. AAP35]|uniref:malto-oligosyltrehalose trehalohydrolase n=1 Tax=Bosea sp. AAP35 TaxID=1523417 RepID=UPI0006B9F22D|nr:malto-oligosyltrehalose trehalohydrolase [Bosea sp. AAP35]KPF67605.1 1,4-alpha-glucan branching protein [Bosea sp. AAP35]
MHRVHAMPFGAECLEKGVRFSLWAPSATSVTVCLDGAEQAMIHEADGWHHLVCPGIAAGALYRYRIDGETLIPDPASRFQPEDVDGPSMVVDPCAFAWSDAEWNGRPWEETVVYEAHVGTATPEGTFAALAAKLGHLRELGVTALELLPLADFPGDRSWGYDGVLHFAPDHAYGTPEDLKRLIDEAHRHEIMVFLDVVYNHFGPAGNYLANYAATFFTERHETLWGAGINFDGETSSVVRDFFVHNALYWLEEYHFDGLRFDAVHAIADDSRKHVIAELAERIRAGLAGRPVHLILENNANQARWLERDETGAPRLHTAQWNDDIHHAWHRLLTDETDGYYADYDDPIGHLGRCLAEGFAYQGEISAHDGVARGEPSGHLPPSAFIAFLQNHDQIGNRAFGERIGALAPPAKLALARAGFLLAPQIPMLFMGEEWEASAPFQYFVDFADDELSHAVREGRQREFAGFGAFGGSVDKPVPDPTSPQTLEQSRLDWSEAVRPPHAEILRETRDLLRLRQIAVLPLTKSRYLGARRQRPTPDTLDIGWNFEAGSMRFVAHFGDGETRLPIGAGEVSLWSSPGVEIGDEIRLPSWTGAMMVARR